jgi:hypothetical protein
LVTGPGGAATPLVGVGGEEEVEEVGERVGVGSLAAF